MSSGTCQPSIESDCEPSAEVQIKSTEQFFQTQLPINQHEITASLTDTVIVIMNKTEESYYEELETDEQ